MAWPDSGTNEVTKTIGATGRNHSTIAAWEADTDDDCTSGWGAGDYASPCSPVGECYDDGDFAENPIINGATTDSTHYRRMVVASGQGHDGTPYGSGVTIDGYVDGRDLYWFSEGFICNNKLDNTFAAASSQHLYRNYVLVGTSSLISAKTTDSKTYITENLVCIGGYVSGGVARNGSLFTAKFYGFYNCDCTNCISIGATHAFETCTGDYNIGSDASAPGAHSIDNKTSAIFASVGSGTEDLHLASGSTDADGAGVAISGLTTDIDGDAYTDPPDIGADQWVAAGGGISIPVVMYHRRMIGVA